jgi:hypothetical protein
LENTKECILKNLENSIITSDSDMLKDLFKHMKYKKLMSLKALIYGLKCKGRGYAKRITDRYGKDKSIGYFNDMKSLYNN